MTVWTTHLAGVGRQRDLLSKTENNGKSAQLDNLSKAHSLLGTPEYYKKVQKVQTVNQGHSKKKTRKL